MRKRFCLIALALCVAAPASADEEVAPTPYVASSFDGRFYFKMLPEKSARFDRDKGQGSAYRVTGDKEDQRLWSTTGWYAYRVFLSYDGVYLVRLGNWPRGHAPSEKDIAVAFYKEGKLLKSYSTQQIVKDKSKVQPSVSHYQFYRGEPAFVEPYGYAFKLTSIDNVEYLFDVRTGEIQRTTPR